MSDEKFNMWDPYFTYKVQLPTGGSRTVDREELMQMSLNSPNHIPELTGHKTWISNYVGTFWSHFMGPTAFAIYFQLVKMAYGDKDHSWPSIAYLAMLTGTSKSTVQRHMKTLIDLNFVIVVEIYNHKKSQNENNVYLLSQTIPFISTTQYKQLPERLQKEHDKFMEKLKHRKVLRSEDIPPYEK